ncbi:RNA polymerase sigma factor CnrH [Anatilimnocola aggregata]|uniref:RNA polymerase sigma factor CnrH n=1 Tax=Anatilimnocola aggregata TaxID=2528021 RepID=A0A517Y665_9BACT|nr:sigma-70 family RNA polymerase sigma factor [Anatilimnocola aggregata]QDU25727.1 RNA polymerase sigma factor CnrH [Anatilimnocola aggregata]
MDTTPVSLLERLRQPGDGRAWSRFVDLYSPLLLTWVRRAGLQQADADDVVQDVFVILVRQLPQFIYNPNQRFRGWLYTVTLNKVRERARQPEVRQNYESLPAEGVAAPLNDALIETEFRTVVIRRAFELMRTDFSPQTWQGCWGHFMEGKTAAELGWTAGALRAAKFRVLSRLRRELAGMLD